MTTQTASLTDFIEQRIAEDEAAARAAIEDDGGSDEGFSRQYALLISPPSGVGIAQGGFGEAAARMIATYAVPARVLAECEAKRRIVEDFSRLHVDYGVTHDPTTEWRRHQALVAISHLAAIYADHPDYDSSWRP